MTRAADDFASIRGHMVRLEMERERAQAHPASEQWRPGCRCVVAFGNVITRNSDCPVHAAAGAEQ